MRDVLLFGLIFLLNGSGIFAQGTVLNGAKVKVNTGTVLVNTGDLIIQDESGSTPEIILSGIIKVSGDLSNQSTAQNIFSNLGSLEMVGAVLQKIDGLSGTIYPVLVISNSSNVQVEDAISISDTLIFVDGQLILLNADLTLDALSDCYGAGATSYINNEGGKVVRTIANNDSPVQFPVGGLNYNPISIAVPISGSSGVFEVEHLEAVYSEGTSGTDFSASSNPLVGVSWVVVAPHSDSYTATLQWNGTDEDPSFDPASAYVSQYTSSWTSLGANTVAGSNPYTMTQSGISGSGVLGIASNGFLLPVDWLDFSAEMHPWGAQLKWETAHEENVSHYVIERSSEGKTWTARSTRSAVNGDGPYEYEVNERWESDARSFLYRVRMVDYNGTGSLSKVLLLRRSIAASTIATVSTTMLHLAPTVHWSNKNATQAKLQLLSMSGQEVYSRSVSLHTIQGISIAPQEVLSPGIYILQIVDDTGQSATFRMYQTLN